MSVLKFATVVDKLIENGTINITQVSEALMTALLEVDKGIRDRVIDKIMSDDFNVDTKS